MPVKFDAQKYMTLVNVTQNSYKWSHKTSFSEEHLIKRDIIPESSFLPSCASSNRTIYALLSFWSFYWNIFTIF